MTLPPATLPNLWHVFNLRESPYFQDTLGGASHSYPLSLFVGRAAETQQLLTTIGGSRSSRQGIGGAPGIGKTTLVQSVKAGAIAAGYWAADELVPFYETDTAEHLLGRLLGGLYDTILAARPMTADQSAMQAAQQLVRVSRLSSGGGSLSVMGIGGGFTKVESALTPTGAILIDGPRIIRDLLGLAREAGARGVVLHLNNLENLTERGADRAADLLRNLRDPVLMLDGLHILLVGTTEAVLRAMGTHIQVRSVFKTTLTLAPMPVADVQSLLTSRYSHLALEGRAAIPPVAPAAIHALYPLFRGDLRSFLSALEDGARLLVGAVPSGASLSVDELRPTLREWYASQLPERLDANRQGQLEAWAKHGSATMETQATLRTLWKLSQPAVSASLAELERQGYVLALPREGRDAIRYVLTGATRLVFG